MPNADQHTDRPRCIAVQTDRRRDSKTTLCTVVHCMVKTRSVINTRLVCGTTFHTTLLRPCRTHQINLVYSRRSRISWRKGLPPISPFPSFLHPSLYSSTSHSPFTTSLHSLSSPLPFTFPSVPLNPAWVIWWHQFHVIFFYYVI